MKTNFIEANLGRATFLRFRGYELDEIVPLGHKMVAFSFLDHDGRARETAAEFSAGGGTSAEALLNCFSELKSLMYQYKSQIKEGQKDHDVIRKSRQNTLQ